MASARNVGLNHKALKHLERVKLWSIDGTGSRITNLCQTLWNSTEEIRKQALNTYFVQGIKNGNMDPTVFGGYMTQDCVFCYKAKDSIDEAASKAADDGLKGFLEHQAQSYLEYYEALFKQWHIFEPNGIRLGEACERYSRFENDVARKDDPVYFVVALIPCAKLWPWLGQNLQTEKHSYGVYDNWFNENFNPKSDGYKKLEEIVNSAAVLGHIDEEKARCIYTECMKGEADFFGSAKPITFKQ